MSDWLKWVLLGVLSILFGVFALNHTVITSLSVTVFVGALFLVSGIAQAIAGFGEDGAGNKLLAIGLGALMAFLGYAFLSNPLQGTISLALLVTLFILAGGVMRVITAFQMRGSGVFWLMLLSGLLSLGLGIYIIANPGLTVALLGIMLGIELLFNGAGLIALGLFKRTADRALSA